MSVDRLLSIYGQPVQSWPGEEALDEEARANLAALRPQQQPKLRPDETFRGTFLPFRETVDGKHEWAVPGFLQDVWDAATAVRDTSGAGLGPMPRPSQYSPEVFEQILGHGMAGALTGITGNLPRLMVKPPAGTIDFGMFGGRSGAEELARKGEPRPLQALNLLEEMEKAGASRDEIWAATGEILKDTPYIAAFRGVDKKPRFEIDDSGAKVRDYPYSPGEAYDEIAHRAFVDGDEFSRASRALAEPYKDRTTDDILAEYKAIGNRAIDMVKSGDKEGAKALLAQREGLDTILSQMGNRRYGPASSYLEHRPLYDAYPALGEMHTRIAPDDLQTGARGHYNPGNPGQGEQIVLRDLRPYVKEDKGVILHEMTHGGPQKDERFARGYNPIEATKDVAQARLSADELRQKIQRIQNAHSDEARFLVAKAEAGDAEAAALVAEAWKSWEPRLGALSDENPYGITPRDAVAAELGERDASYNRLVKSYNEAFRTGNLDPQELYRRQAGETEARLVQSRRDLTPDQRLANPPWQEGPYGYDVPESQQIVRFGNEGMASSTPVERLVVRDAGSNIGSEGLGSVSRPGHVYRGMTADEYDATIGAGAGVRSRGDYSHVGEGTNFAESFADAESYVNFGRDDPRKSGRPTYIVEAPIGEGMVQGRDGYWKSHGETAPSRVWKVEADESGALVGTLVNGGDSPNIMASMGDEGGRGVSPVFDWGVGQHSGSREVSVGGSTITYGINPQTRRAQIALVKTPKSKRGQGAARAAMETFLREADERGYTVSLTADPMEKGVSKPKLEAFYRSLGFVANKGKNKDFTTRDGMIREPGAKAKKADGGRAPQPLPGDAAKPTLRRLAQRNAKTTTSVDDALDH